MAPLRSVDMASEGSIGEIVVPEIRHWTTCATISTLRVIRHAARHPLARELRMPG